MFLIEVDLLTIPLKVMPNEEYVVLVRRNPWHKFCQSDDPKLIVEVTVHIEGECIRKAGCDKGISNPKKET